MRRRAARGAIGIVHVSLGLGLALALVLPPGVARARSADTTDSVPEGLSASDWAGIRQAYEAHRYAARPVEGGYVAGNPGQQWQTRFDGRGFTTRPDRGAWTWGLALERYGFAGRERAIAGAARVRAEGGRVVYDRAGGLEEWYVNDGRGLEHGYRVRERAPREAESDGPLRFTLAVRGGLSPEVAPDGRSVRFLGSDGKAVVRYAGLAVLDRDGRALPARFESAGGRLALAVDERGARYPLTVDPIAQQAYLKASNADAADEFGLSVAVSGDTVVVGAPYEASSATGIDGDESDNSAPSAGAAYVFVRSGSAWSQQAYLKASKINATDYFGYSVALSGDTVVVGAVGEDSSATGVDGDGSDNSAPTAGAAYVFVRSGSTWSQQAYLKASNTDAGDWFGWSVAVSGDTVVVGAWGEDSSATGVDGDESDNSFSYAGAAYVFVRSGSAWSQQAYLKASNTDADDSFGWSVAVSSDTVVVGAYDESSSATGVDGNESDNSASGAGAAYVFVRSGSTWSQQAYLKASNTDAGDEFGYSVTVSNDTVGVGADGEASGAAGVDGDESDNSAADAGAAYVFVRSGSTWSQQAYLKASNTDAGDYFGTSVAVSGDTAVVGAYYESSSATGVDGDGSDNSTSHAGAAYVFLPEPGASLMFAAGTALVAALGRRRARARR